MHSQEEMTKDIDITNTMESGTLSNINTSDVTTDTSFTTRPDVSIVIPVYNEEEAIPCVLDAIYKVIDDTYEVIVVDDGSVDNTRLAVSAFPCRLITHDGNRGKGAAIKTGIQHSSCTFIVIIDGDATYPADIIPKIRSQLQQYDLVRCVRTTGRENIPFINRLGNNILEKIVDLLHGIDYTDFMSGLYGIRRHHLLKMDLESDGFDIETEIAIKAKSHNLNSTNIPIHYSERLGDKKLKPFQDGLKILGRMAKIAVSYNPVALFVVPGLFLWAAAILIWLITSFILSSGYRPNSFLLSGMTFLAGFQLIVFGYQAILYQAKTGLGKPNPTLIRWAKNFPYLPFIFLGILLIFVGGIWSIILISKWAINGAGYFFETQVLIITLTTVVLGIQMLSTTLFLWLFTDRIKLY